MSSLTRFFHKFHTTRNIRAYSSFFSSKPGGGRYFNPAKPPKVVPAASKRNNKPAVDQATASPDTADDISTSNFSSGEHQHNHSSANNQTVEHDGNAVPKSDSTSTFTHSTTLPRGNTPSYPHPMIGDKDFKLHQFFSLHRPLLLLSNPSSVLAGPPPGTSIFSRSAPPPQETANLLSKSAVVPEDILSEVSYEADAETARTLTRAMTIARLGSVVDWEATMQRLGLESHSESERAELKERLDKEYRDVVMDSVKRKRRKKMKKHKLKKRRRDTRAQRLKMR
ncbi:hypothetical protein E1B28_008978 [Marasmius oreades]|uniref:Ribosomal protein mS38 C-terminal domain-containing protein n=1 Tax=Marasmius oreades TaxID=181124 RepID=A0A9P7RZH4_9AGAR|nr:uncharacterized protein E1B28_008978 [Marasmius oreades]KAG7092636.1 hypothetical protein E1B28_008978 [Marasmius oreades]